jgi:hypothetical protein
MKYASLRLPDELHSVLEKTAAQNHRSLHGEMLRAFEYYLKNAPEAHYDATSKPAKEVSEKSK